MGIEAEVGASVPIFSVFKNERKYTSLDYIYIYRERKRK